MALHPLRKSTPAPRRKNNGSALTESRQIVLDIVQKSKKPIGAYAVLERFKDSHPNAAPPTIYRALDYLTKSNLVHRIEKLNAYVACCEQAHDHRVQFLVCTSCGKTREIDATDLIKSTEKLAEELGFTIKQSIVELIGHCQNCDP